MVEENIIVSACHLHDTCFFTVTRIVENYEVFLRHVDECMDDLLDTLFFFEARRWYVVVFYLFFYERFHIIVFLYEKWFFHFLRMKPEHIHWRIYYSDIVTSWPPYEPFLIHTRVRHDLCHFMNLIEVELLSEPESYSIEFMEKEWNSFHIFSTSFEELMWKGVGIVEYVSARFDPMHSGDRFIWKYDSIIIFGNFSRKEKPKFHTYISDPTTINLMENLNNLSVISKFVRFIRIIWPNRGGDISFEDICHVYIDSFCPWPMDEAIMEYESLFCLHGIIVAHLISFCKNTSLKVFLCWFFGEYYFFGRILSRLGLIQVNVAGLFGLLACWITRGISRIFPALSWILSETVIFGHCCLMARRPSPHI